MIESILLQKYPNISLDIYEKSSDRLILSRIVIPKEMQGSGIGTQVMNDIVTYADQHNKKIFLTPSTDFGGSSVSRLTNFYKRFGFVMNKGRNKDYSEMQSMVRYPNNGINEELSRIKSLL